MKANVKISGFIDRGSEVEIIAIEAGKKELWSLTRVFKIRTKLCKKIRSIKKTTLFDSKIHFIKVKKPGKLAVHALKLWVGFK